MALAGSLTIPTGNALNLAVSYGGTGGAGANAGTVTVNSTGAITTLGDAAEGVLAQSLGGGGGNGRLSVAATINGCTTCPSNVPSIAAAIGGKGGSGGAGGNVNLTHAGALVTFGEKSPGLRAQSIGGGGGNGGIAIAGTISGGESKQFAGSVGGFGGPGSTAGTAVVANTGSITTGEMTTVSVQLPFFGQVFGNFLHRSGTESHGIVAQSIGGGGGSGGLAISGAIGLVGATSNVNVGVSVGGFGGSGGTSGLAKVTNTGVITTLGHAAHGVFAQSIGGGGGNGGGSISGLLGAGNPTATTARAVNVSISVGGFGGDGNFAGPVVVNQSGEIQTSGNGSNGIFAQSIGGGGGTAGDANSISLFLGTKCSFDPIGILGKHIKSCQLPGKGGVSVQIAVGGFGGKGNHAGTVTVTNNGFIATSGFASAGIKAQSIGAGGGSGGNGMVGTDGLAPGVFDDGLGGLLTVVGQAGGRGDTARSVGKFTFGGSGGASGNGDTVIVTNLGQISILGDQSYGILAQSIGGGGGDGGAASSGMTGLFSWGGSGGASGNGGEVTVTNQGFIYTTGTFTRGVVAQSIGGGGGDGGNVGGIIAIGGSASASGNGAKVTITNEGNVTTLGNFAVGLLAQSIGGGGGGHSASGGDTGTFGISLIAIGGSGGATGTGGEVTINNFGSITTLGFGADAIRAESIGGGGGSSGDNSGGQVNGLVFGLGGSGGGGGTAARSRHQHKRASHLPIRRTAFSPNCGRRWRRWLPNRPRHHRRKQRELGTRRHC
jgi:hypothetical protein